MAVAEHGSLRAAARYLSIAQPGLSRSIREIEHELGVSLFERHARGIRLTALGEIFVKRAEAIQVELDRARQEIGQLSGDDRGEVSIALSAASAIALMPAVVRLFHRRYPRATIKVMESLFQGAEVDLLRGKIDFYIGPINADMYGKHLHIEKLIDSQRVIVGRRDHPLTNSTSLSDLEEAEWIRPTLSSRVSEVDFDDWFRSMGLKPPKIVMHSHSALFTLITIASSDFLTILPLQWMESPMVTLQVQALEITPPVQSAPFCIVRRHDLPLTPIAEGLYDLIRRASTNYVLNSCLG